MIQKYILPQNSSKILTSDVYLVAYLLTQECRIAKVMKNERSRISFLVEGDKAEDLRRRYKRGPVFVNVRFLREKVLTLRRLMDGKQRSVTCPRELLMKSSRV